MRSSKNDESKRKNWYLKLEDAASRQKWVNPKMFARGNYFMSTINEKFATMQKKYFKYYPLFKSKSWLKCKLRPQIRSPKNTEFDYSEKWWMCYHWYLKQVLYSHFTHGTSVQHRKRSRRRGSPLNLIIFHLQSWRRLIQRKMRILISCALQCAITEPLFTNYCLTKTINLLFRSVTKAFFHFICDLIRIVDIPRFHA